MKKILALAVAAAIILTAVPLFAGDAGSAKGEEKTPFQMISDTLKPGAIKDKNKLIPVPKEQVSVFQSLSDGFKEGSIKAKGESLRGTK